MLARALWTLLIGLLAWIPLGRESAARLGSESGERSLLRISALDLAADPSSRVGEAHNLPRQLASVRRAPAWRALPTQAPGVEPPSTVRALGWRASNVPTPTSWRGFQAPRLTFPHDATAPPRPA